MPALIVREVLPSIMSSCSVCGSTNEAVAEISSTWLRSSWWRAMSMLVRDDLVGADQQVLHRDVLLDPVRRAVELARAEAGEVEHRLAQRLRRDGAEIDADAADDRGLLDDRDLLVELGGLDRGALPGRAGADHHEIVVVRRSLP